MKIPDFLNETTDVKESIFSRENLVENIYNFINQNQKKQGIKIGLYGKWGTGKTTLLLKLKKKFDDEVKSFKFIKTRPQVIFLDIRNVSTLNKVYDYFLEDIKQSFGFFKAYFFLFLKIFIALFILIFLAGFLIEISKSVISAFKVGDPESLLNEKTIIGLIISSAIVPIIKYLFSVNFIKGYNNTFDAVFITLYLLGKKLLGRKVLIVVDDLDRLNPKYLPDILLWLSHISQFEKGIVNVIISADPIKLAEGIKTSNSHYSGNEGYEFLEKVVDTPYYIDNLTYENKYTFWNKYKKELISDFQGFESVELFIDYLPDNIRQIKRYFRFIYTYLDEISRFDSNELNYDLLLITALFKLEHPRECFEFMESDIKKIDSGIMFLKDDEKLENFEKELNSEVKSKYLQHYVGKLFFLQDIVNYYYFFDSLPRITDKEFQEKFIENEENFSILQNLYKDDIGSLLVLLAKHISNRYSIMVSEGLVEDMKKREEELLKIYNYLENIIQNIDKEIFLSEKQIEDFFGNLNQYSNFERQGSGIDYSAHRNIDSRIIESLIRKINPKNLFDNKYHIVNFGGNSEEIDSIYWGYLLNLFPNQDFGYDLVRSPHQELIFKEITNNSGIQDLNNLEIANSNVQRNFQYLLYSFLEVVIKNPSEREGIRDILGTEDFKIFLENINLSNSNHRSLGSLKKEVLEKLPNDIKGYFSEFQKELQNYLLN